MKPAEQAHIFHQGVDLFNRGHWFEAHETWEDVWHVADGERKRFLQGLIQCAVTLEHLARGNPRGVIKVFASAKSKWVDLPDVYMGVPVRELIEQLDQLIEPIRQLPAERFSPALGRGQALPVDLANAPQITLKYDPFKQD